MKSNWSVAVLLSFNALLVCIACFTARVMMNNDEINRIFDYQPISSNPTTITVEVVMKHGEMLCTNCDKRGFLMAPPRLVKDQTGLIGRPAHKRLDYIDQTSH